MSLVFLRSIPLKKVKNCAGICKQYMGARNQVEIELSYGSARLHSLAELLPWNRFLGSLKVKKIRALRGKVRGGAMEGEERGEREGNPRGKGGKERAQRQDPSIPAHAWSEL
jgi:hypothetical protein